MLVWIIYSVLVFFAGFCIGRAYQSYRTWEQQQQEQDIWDAQ
jgi:uncharacterized membrane protein